MQHEAEMQCIPPVVVSKKESCRLLGNICMRTLENMITDKQLPVRLVRGRVMIPYAALLKFGK